MIYTQEEWINQAKIKHNNIFNYSKVIYKKSNIKVIITCKKHGDFKQLPYKHLKGQKCPYCAKNKLNTSLFIQKSIKKHNNKYIYNKVEYKKSNIKVIITCKIHGDFEIRPNNHLNGQGCIKCSKIKITTDDIIKKFKKVHNNKYTYECVEYINSLSKVKINCKIHGYFLQKPKHHLIGKGCKKCGNNGVSKKQFKWLKIKKIIDNTNIINMNDNNYEYYIEKNKKKYYADGYSKKLNKIYEFHGDYWHGNPKKYNLDDINKSNKKTFRELYNKTINKMKIIKDKNYNLEIMWEYDWDNYLKLLKDIRKHKNNYI